MRCRAPNRRQRPLRRLPAAGAARLIALLALAISTAPAAAQDTSTAAADAALLDAWSAPPAPAALPPLHLDLGPVPIALEADRFGAQPLLGTFVAEGHAVLRRGSLTVFADRLLLDRRLGSVIAEGHVIAVEGPAVLSCQRAVFSIPDLDGAIDDAELRVKRAGTRTATGTAALHAGVDTMRLTADRLERTGPRAFALTGSTFTPCRCAEGSAPDWKLGASAADVDVDSGAWLYGPVLYVKDVPVLVLPVLYVPLGERRTGLLLPRAGYTTTQGFELTLPLYVTLGRSLDATLDLSGWLNRGPAPGLELRWAPAANQRGELHGTVLFDFGERIDGSWSPTGELDPRFGISGRHRGAFGATTLAADVNLAGDLDFVREFGDQLLDRQVEESVSRLTVAAPAGDHLRVAAGLSLRQDLRIEDYRDTTDRRTIRLFDSDHDIAYRFAELRVDALPHPLLAHALSPLARARLIADATGTLADTRDVRARADLRPSLAWPLTAHGLSLVPELALRLTGQSTAGDSEGRIAGLVRTAGAIELHRRYGPVTHVLRPRATHLWLELLAGDARAPGRYDDELTILGPAHQLDLALENELYLAGRSTRLAALAVHFPRDLRPSVREGRTADDRTPLAIARAEVSTLIPDGSLRATGFVELDTDPLTVPQWRVTASAARTALGSASLTYATFGDAPPLSDLIGGEELLYSAAVPVPERWSPFRGFIASASATPVPGLRIDATAFVDLDANAPLRLLRGGVSWDSPCECWSATVVVEKSSDRDIPSFRFALDLAQVGGTGF